MPDTRTVVVAKTLIVNRYENTRVPFLRGILIRSLQDAGLDFDDAFGLASSVPGRSPLLDGFGLIALASLFPMITVMAYAQISEWRTGRARRKQSSNKD